MSTAKSMRSTWDGLAELKEDLLKLLPADALKIMETAGYETAEEIITEAKKLTPVLEGVLKSSGHVQLPVISGNQVEVSMGFGGPAGAGNQGETNRKEVGYAVVVHENLEAHHKVGQAKYLEMPFDRMKDKMIEKTKQGLERRRGKNSGTNVS